MYKILNGMLILGIIALGLLLQGCGGINASASGDSSSMPAQISTDAQ